MRRLLLHFPHLMPETLRLSPGAHDARFFLKDAASSDHIHAAPRIPRHASTRPRHPPWRALSLRVSVEPGRRENRQRHPLCLCPAAHGRLASVQPMQFVHSCVPDPRGAAKQAGWFSRAPKDITASRAATRRPRNASRRDAENAHPSRIRSGAQLPRVHVPIQADRPAREWHSDR